MSYLRSLIRRHPLITFFVLAFALSTGCLSGPKIYVKEHLPPAGDLSFQLDLKGVPLAQNETIHLLLGSFYARGSTEQVVDLAGGAPF